MLHGIPKKGWKVDQAYRKGESLYLRSEAGILRFLPLTAQSVRVSCTVNGEFSHMQGKELKLDEETPEWVFSAGEDEIVLMTEKLKIRVERKSGRIFFCNPDGRPYLSEADKNARVLEPFQTGNVILDPETEIETVETADGRKKVLRNVSRVLDRTLYRVRMGFEFAEGERLYGLGQHQEGLLNLRGTVQYLHQANRKIAVPMMLSDRNYGILLTTQSAFLFHDDAFGSYFQTEGDEMLDYCFLAGNSLDDVITQNRKLTGKAALLPRWMFGYLQSRERYETEKEIVDTVERFRKTGFGLDGIILDWQSWEGDLWGQKTFDPARFPHPDRMVKKTEEQGAHLMMSVWPNMSSACDNYREFAQRQLLLPGTEIYDAFSPEARKLYTEQLERGLGCHGIDAWWCDSCEPVTPEWNHLLPQEPAHMYREYVEEAGKSMPLDRINAYALYHAQGIYEYQRSKTMTKRAVNLTRSGWSGIQKYGAVLWSGDISASWETLRRQITAGLSLSASGLPYWTVDIGGFFVTEGTPWYWDGQYPEGTEDPAYRELYVRWFQFGAFLPVFRSHGTEYCREPWQFGKSGEPFYDALKKTCEERYRLLPYIYSAAWQVWKEDGTMLRLLAFDYPDDAVACSLKDEYMFGPSLLICPVTEPMYYDRGRELSGEKTRRVYLPAGNGWYDYHTGRKYQGGQWIDTAAPLSEIPVFVREGAVLPLMEAESCTVEMDGSAVTVRIYSGKDGTFTLYEDAGDGYGYEKGEYCETVFRWKDESGELFRETFQDIRWRKGEIRWEIVRDPDSENHRVRQNK